MIGLCTDSNSQIPPALTRRFGVEVVPLTVTVDGVDHLEGVDLDADGFYALFADRTPDVATSQPSPGRFLEAYRRLADRGCTEIVSIHVTAAMSGTVSAATLAAAESPVPVRVVDSGTASFGVACCVWAAGTAREGGADPAATAAAAERLAPDIGTVFVVGAPRLAERGGRMRNADLTGEGVPVLTMRAGEVVVLERVHDTEAAVEVMSAYVRGRGQPVNAAIGISDAGSRPLAVALAAAVRDLGPELVADVVEYRIGPSVGAHTGPGTTGLFVFPAA